MIIFFFFFEGRENPNTIISEAIIGPPFKWRFAGVPMMTQHFFCDFQGVWTSITKKPYIFVILQVGGGVRLDGSFEKPQHMFWLRNKIFFLVTHYYLEATTEQVRTPAGTPNPSDQVNTLI